MGNLPRRPGEEKHMVKVTLNDVLLHHIRAVLP